MTTEKALDLALEALDNLARYADTCELFLKETHPGKADALRQRITKSIQAIAAIKQARSASVQEPVGYWNAVEGWVKIDEVREHFDSVGCGTIYKTAGDGRVPLTAAQRQWVSLTDEDIIKCTPTWGGTVEDVARAIEAKLREKNGGQE